MQIRLGTGCFYFWNLSLQEIVDKVGNIVDGFEFIMDYKKINDFNGIDLLPEHKCNSIHLCPHEKSFNAFDNLKSVMKELNVKQVIVHPQQLDNFEQIPDDINFLIENMDFRKGSFIKISEVLNLVNSRKNFGFNLDICHLEELENGLTDKMIDSFKHKIDAMHISLPESKLLNIDNCPHYLCFDSGLSMPKKLPTNIPWTIEGIIPINSLEMLKKEVEFLRGYKSL
jgi:hypothetical protein